MAQTMSKSVIQQLKALPLENLQLNDPKNQFLSKSSIKQIPAKVIDTFRSELADQFDQCNLSSEDDDRSDSELKANINVLKSRNEVQYQSIH